MAKKKTTEETPATPGEETPAKKPAAKKKAAPKAEAAAEATPAAESKPAKAPAAKKTAAKTPSKPAAPATAGFGFGIDTNLAAQSAARMLLNRPASPTSSSGGGTVKHLKDSLNKPQGLGNLLGGNTGPAGKASNLPHFSNQQKGHNQATGHVGNTGVPRRTPG